MSGWAAEEEHIDKRLYWRRWGAGGTLSEGGMGGRAV
jgi:hypothetical protein